MCVSVCVVCACVYVCVCVVMFMQLARYQFCLVCSTVQILVFHIGNKLSTPQRMAICRVAEYHI